MLWVMVTLFLFIIVAFIWMVAFTPKKPVEKPQGLSSQQIREIAQQVHQVQQEAQQESQAAITETIFRVADRPIQNYTWGTTTVTRYAPVPAPVPAPSVEQESAPEGISEGSEPRSRLARLATIIAERADDDPQ